MVALIKETGIPLAVSDTAIEFEGSHALRFELLFPVQMTFGVDPVPVVIRNLIESGRYGGATPAFFQVVEMIPVPSSRIFASTERRTKR